MTFGACLGSFWRVAFFAVFELPKNSTTEAGGRVFSDVRLTESFCRFWSQKWPKNGWSVGRSKSAVFGRRTFCREMVERPLVVEIGPKMTPKMTPNFPPFARAEVILKG